MACSRFSRFPPCSSPHRPPPPRIPTPRRPKPSLPPPTRRSPPPENRPRRLRPAHPRTRNAKPTLGDGLIAQNALRIYLNRPAIITVHDSRGQLLYHIESVRPMEYLPLSGVHTGFLYLTLRAGRLETTKKLIYSGK